MSQPYAPTTYTSSSSFLSSAAMRSKIPLNEDARLYRTSAQRDMYESLAEIYSIIVTLDFVEKAYVKDSISQGEYTPVCSKLLAQYNTILKNQAVAAELGDLDRFCARYDIEYTSAISRLRVGIPATVENPVTKEVDYPTAASSPAPNKSAASARAAADAIGNFITFMDALKLNYKAKDQLHPLLGELMTSLNAYTTQDFEGRGKIIEWLIRLNAMKATDEISDDQARQLLFDIGDAYKAFYAMLE
ncbi:vacuolar protein sorting-associated [Lipomyces arxii]|uniref:vacuolar protein sorting-associated n=1 Tax=Lipomyces arxii TaxID=56418 RepID=UPI0034CDB2B7